MSYKPVNIYILDDEFPKTPEFIAKSVYDSAISSDNIYHLAITQNWLGLQPLQQLIKDIINSKPFADGMINLSGFTKPPQALSAIDKGEMPDIVIYDWEYDMPKPKESQDWLLEVLGKTKAFVFVYSKVRDELPPFLNKEIFDKHANRFQLFLKGSSENTIFSSEEFILQYLLSRVSSNYQIKLRGIEINFSSNGYIENPSDILHLENIVGRNFLLDELKDLDFSITQENVEKLIEKANGKLLFDESRGFLITPDSTIFVEQFKPNTEITYIEALKKFGLMKLKEVLEVGLVKI